MREPTLLFVTPFIPSSAGVGVGMRAGAHIQALLDLFEVTLAIVNCGNDVASVTAQIPPQIRRACSSIIVVSRRSVFDTLHEGITSHQGRLLLEAIWPTPVAYTQNAAALRELAARLAHRRFDAVHCFRMHTSKLIKLLRRHHVGYSRSIIDVDDYESIAKFRLARQLKDFIGFRHSLLRNLEAVKMAAVEARMIPRFTDGYACSERDKSALQKRFPGTRWTVVPNVLPAAEPIKKIGQDLFTFIFVGALRYQPNKDGVIFFCNSVLPLLHKIAPRPFRVVVAGRTPDSDLVQLARDVGVDIVANPPAVAPFYAMADAAIVPLRAGGGTRIKILEAFSYRLPVVSTAIGAEGLEITPGVHALISDSPADFAASCRRIMLDEGLRRSLGNAGHDLFRRRFSSEVLAETLRATLGILPSRPSGQAAEGVA